MYLDVNNIDINIHNVNNKTLEIYEIYFYFYRFPAIDEKDPEQKYAVVS